MKSAKKVIHIIKHIPTGAKVPIVITKMLNENVIEDYKEVLDNRKGFTLDMLTKRWDKCKEDVMEILQEFQVPGHLRHQEVIALPEGKAPLDVAIFFEEYIYGIEKKTKMSHKKLKPRPIKDETKH